MGRRKAFHHILLCTFGILNKGNILPIEDRFKYLKTKQNTSRSSLYSTYICLSRYFLLFLHRWQCSRHTVFAFTKVSSSKELVVTFARDLYVHIPQI